MKKVFYSTLLLFFSFTMLQAQAPEAHSSLLKVFKKSTQYPGNSALKTTNIWTPLRSTHYIWSHPNNAWDSTALHNYTYFWNGEIATDSITVKTGQGWVPSQKVVNTLDASGRISDQERFDWDNGVWDYQGKDFARFDSQDNLTLSGTISSFMGGPLDTLVASRTRYTYDAQGQITEQIFESFWLGNWSIDFRYVYTYTGSGEPLTESGYTWNGSAWEADDLVEYSYNAQGLPDSLFISFWDGSAYEAEARFVDVLWHDYSKELVLSYIEESSGNNGISWEKEARTTNTYGLYDSYVELNEDWSGSVWETASRSKVQYDSEYNQVLSESAQFNNGMWEIDYGRRNDFDYDGNSNILSEEEEYYNSDSAAYIPSRRIEYESFVLDRETPAELNELKIWPVPAKDILHLSVGNQKNTPATYRLLDLQGKTLSSGTFSPATTHSIDLPRLEPGIYLMQVEQDHLSSTRKFLVL